MLHARLAKSSLGSAALIENLTPEHDKYADYLLVYEAVIAPPRLDQARIELWVGEEGNLAVGIENQGRIAERLRKRTGSPVQFIAGHEPLALEMAHVEKLVEVVAGGGLVIPARHAFGRILSTTAEVAVPADAPYGFRAYAKSLRIGFDLPIGARAELGYRPW